MSDVLDALVAARTNLDNAKEQLILIKSIQQDGSSGINLSLIHGNFTRYLHVPDSAIAPILEILKQEMTNVAINSRALLRKHNIPLDDAE